MFSTAVLILYLSTTSASTGMAITTAEFASTEACETAGKQAKQKFGGWATNVYWSCAPKGEASSVPQSR